MPTIKEQTFLPIAIHSSEDALPGLATTSAWVGHFKMEVDRLGQLLFMPLTRTWQVSMFVLNTSCRMIRSSFKLTRR
ncbi:hypothetical protein TB9_09365 [Xanthomonas perforans]|nr:hypothetical protein XP816_00270 [Xanthomonas perforans]KLC55858.1 hypothetical protein XP2010_00560 [Xanthomonas perforans]KLD17833.1 hypothetical protein GEV1054_13505 [Xanthomonas perforans]KLD20503.1 hypothetical protein GEV1044_02615 [Xanthomonas perforans]KLD29555.1 hypothetical protein TB6_10320 [Xanthomonas perforans]